jgi:hypothetical protein
MGVTGAQPLKTGELSRAIAVIKARYCLGNNPAAHLDVCSYQAVILLSQLLAAQGHVAEAQELPRAAVIDANIALYGSRPRGALTAALLPDGRKDAALDTPTEAFRSEDYKFWWYTTALLRGAAFQPLRARPQRSSLWG